MPFFVVITEQGPTWAPSVDMRQQDEWAGHASFMNALVDEGFVVLGGPIDTGDRHRARLIVKAESQLRGRTAGAILDEILEKTPLDIGELKTA